MFLGRSFMRFAINPDWAAAPQWKLAATTLCKADSRQTLAELQAALNMYDRGGLDQKQVQEMSKMRSQIQLQAMQLKQFQSHGSNASSAFGGGPLQVAGTNRNATEEAAGLDSLGEGAGMYDNLEEDPYRANHINVGQGDLSFGQQSLLNVNPFPAMSVTGFGGGGDSREKEAKDPALLMQIQRQQDAIRAHELAAKNLAQQRELMEKQLKEQEAELHAQESTAAKKQKIASVSELYFSLEGLLESASTNQNDEGLKERIEGTCKLITKTVYPGLNFTPQPTVLLLRHAIMGILTTRDRHIQSMYRRKFTRFLEATKCLKATYDNMMECLILKLKSEEGNLISFDGAVIQTFSKGNIEEAKKVFLESVVFGGPSGLGETPTF